VVDEPRRDLGRSASGDGTSIRAFRHGGTGLRRILGSLEAELLQAMWKLTSDSEDEDAGWTTIGAVCRSLGPAYNYKTAQTVLNRMMEKRLLARRRRGRAHQYRPCMTYDQLVESVTRDVVDGLVGDFGDVAIAQLIRTIGAVSPAHLALLQEVAGAASLMLVQQEGPAEAEHGAPEATSPSCNVTAR